MKFLQQKNNNLFIKIKQDSVDYAEPCFLVNLSLFF